VNMKVILLKVLTGASLGVVAGVFLAPQRGAETRQQLGEGTAMLRSRAQELASRVRESETSRRLMEGGARIGGGIAGRASSVGQGVWRRLGSARQEMRSGSGESSGYEALHQEYDILQRELENRTGRSISDSSGWILVGGLIGVVIGILMAPKPGRETRDELARRAKQLRAQSENIASDFVLRSRGRSNSQG
jgi:gas vesicle protein